MEFFTIITGVSVVAASILLYKQKKQKEELQILLQNPKELEFKQYYNLIKKSKNSYEQEQILNKFLELNGGILGIYKNKLELSRFYKLKKASFFSESLIEEDSSYEIPAEINEKFFVFKTLVNFRSRSLDNKSQLSHSNVLEVNELLDLFAIKFFDREKKEFAIQNFKITCEFHIECQNKYYNDYFTKVFRLPFVQYNTEAEFGDAIIDKIYELVHTEGTNNSIRILRILNINIIYIELTPSNVSKQNLITYLSKYNKKIKEYYAKPNRT